MTQSTITDKFQTTIPREVRKALGLKPRQRVSYEIRSDGSAVLRPEPDLDELFGSLKPKRPVVSAADEKVAARQGLAREAAREGIE
jgi:antitoxin PrlF